MINNLCLEVDLDKIKNNITNIKLKFSKKKILFVIKSDAYGHGLIKVAECAKDIVDYFGVATAQEGKLLRQYNIQNPIIVLSNYLESDALNYIKYNLIATISCQENAEHIDKVAFRCNKIARVALAVDTGMGRIGYLPEQINDILKLKHCKNIVIDNIFTHLATADVPGSKYAKTQLKKFSKILDFAKKNALDYGITHAFNSACALNFNECPYDMLRIGILAYGLYPAKNLNKCLALEPAMQISTKIAYIKDLPKNHSIGYGASFKTTKKTRVATLPVGYADGIPRLLSNAYHVVINGERANIIGKICMNQTMVDITNIKNVNIKSKVIFIGNQGNESISFDDWSNITGAINYEFICNFAYKFTKKYKHF